MSMTVLLLFLLAGCVAGWMLRNRAGAIAGIQRLTRYAMWALLFSMGGKLALHRALFSKDLAIFAWALGSTVLLALLYFAGFALLRLLGFGKSEPRDRAPEVQPQGSGALMAVALNTGWILAGFLGVTLLPSPATLGSSRGTAAVGLLDLLLFLIGFDLGAELHRLDLRQLALPVLLAPLLNIALSLGCGLLFAWLRGMPLRQGLILYSGMGWYSLTPVIIAEQGLVLLSVLAFIHNISRELLAILTAPLAARVSPYLPIYLGGATTMDVMLPFVQRYSGRTYTLASFYSGLICSLAVAPLVRMLLLKP